MVPRAKGVIERIDPYRPHPHEYLTVGRSRCRKINEPVLGITAVGAILDGFHGLNGFHGFKLSPVGTSGSSSPTGDASGHRLAVEPSADVLDRVLIEAGVKAARDIADVRGGQYVR